jgi:hypothetical protein
MACPTRGTLGPREDEDLTFEGLATQFVAHLDYLAGLGIDPAESGNGLSGDDGLALGDTTDNRAAA